MSAIFLHHRSNIHYFPKELINLSYVSPLVELDANPIFGHHMRHRISSKQRKGTTAKSK